MANGHSQRETTGWQHYGSLPLSTLLGSNGVQHAQRESNQPEKLACSRPCEVAISLSTIHRLACISGTMAGRTHAIFCPENRPHPILDAAADDVILPPSRPIRLAALRIVVLAAVRRVVSIAVRLPARLPRHGEGGLTQANCERISLPRVDDSHLKIVDRALRGTGLICTDSTDVVAVVPLACVDCIELGL